VPKKRKPFFNRKRAIHVYFPKTIYAEIEDMLQDTCQGNNFSERVRVFFCEALSLWERGTNPIKPIQAYEADRRKALIAEFGTDDPTQICIRKIDFKTILPTKRARTCEVCEVMFKDHFKACKELRAECKNNLQKVGLTP